MANTWKKTFTDKFNSDITNSFKYRHKSSKSHSNEISNTLETLFDTDNKDFLKQILYISISKNKPSMLFEILNKYKVPVHFFDSKMNPLYIDNKVNVNSIIIVIKQFNSQNTFSISQIHFIERRNSESHKNKTQKKRKTSYDSSDSDEEWCPNPTKKRKKKKRFQ